MYFPIWLHQVLVVACGVYFPDWELSLGPLCWEHGVLATRPPGKPFNYIYIFKEYRYSGDTRQIVPYLRGLPGWLSGKESACWCRRYRRHWFDPWVGKIPWRRKGQPTPVFSRGKSQGQRSLVDHSP